MTKNILNAALVLLSAGSLLTGCDFEQPEAPCFVQDATNWYAKYDPVDEPRDANGAACAVSAPLGERIGVYKFTDPDDLSKSLLTIRPNGTAALGARDTGDSKLQTAVGSLAAEPDADDFCAATGFSAATADAPATASAPANNIRYEFSNVRVYSAPQAPGTQLTGELKYTRNGCTSTYVVRALWPAEPCIVGANRDTDPADACGNGSGLNPDFDAECMAFPTGVAPNCGSLDPATQTGCCVPKKAIPSFLATAE
jgi:hypothetical protein